VQPNGPAVRRRPQKFQETWRVAPGVRTSRWLDLPYMNGFVITKLTAPMAPAATTSQNTAIADH